MVDTSSSGEAPAGSSADKPSPRHPYWQQVHIEFVAAMVAVVAALSVLGVIWLPQSGAYVTVPEDLTVNVYGQNTFPVVETLEQTHGGGTVLQVAEDTCTICSPVEPEQWAVTVGDLARGRVCQPHPGGPLFPDGNPLPTTTRVVYPPNGMTTVGRADIFTLGGTGDRTPYTTVTGTGPLLVWLCWGSGGPDRVDGSYLSAFMPPAVNGALATADSEYARPIPSTGPAISDISRFVLVPDGADTADYTVQAASAPSVSSFNGLPAWKWPGSTILSPILVTGSDATTSQHEVYFSFLSGIAFGVAGGAAIAILQELLDPLSHRRDRRHRAPEGAEQ